MSHATEYRPQVRLGDLDGLTATSLEEMSTVADLKQFIRNRGGSDSDVLWSPDTGRADLESTDFAPMGNWIIEPGLWSGYRVFIGDRDQVVGRKHRCRSEREVVQTILRNDELEPPLHPSQLPAPSTRPPAGTREQHQQGPREQSTTTDDEEQA